MWRYIDCNLQGVDAYDIYIVKEVPAGLPRPKVINFGRNELTSTIGALIVLVFIGFVETISVAKKFAGNMVIIGYISTTSPIIGVVYEDC